MYDPSWEEALFVDRASLDPDEEVTPFVAAQRVVIRLLFDPDFVERVYADPQSALAGTELDPALVAQLLENDRRLWNADRLRRWRALKILMDEFKATTTLVLRECRQLAFLDAFFSSEIFHAAVQVRGYMALAFVRYIEDAVACGRLSSEHTRAVLRVEAEMARSRRELRDARRGVDRVIRGVQGLGSGELVVVLPGVRSVILPGGTLDTIQHIEKYLFQSSQVPALALCEDAPPPDPLPPLSDERSISYLLEPEPRGKVELSEIPETFARLVAMTRRPRAPPQLCREAEEQGIDPSDVDSLVNQLIDGGVLRRV